MKKSREITGLSVISIQEGKELGIVKQLVVDSAAGSVIAMLIDDGKSYLGAKALPFSTISGIGEYAVTVNSESDIVATSTFDQFLSKGIDIVGSLAVTRDGNIAGTISEIVIDVDGKIVECLAKTAAEETFSVSAQRIVTYGKDVLIISTNDAETTILNPSQPVVVPITTPSENTPETHIEVEQESKQLELSEPVKPTESISIKPAEPVESVEHTDSVKPAESTEPDALAKMFEEKQRKYMLGKRASRRIDAENGVIVIEQGEEITETVLQKAKLAGKFVELSMSIY